MQLSSWQHQDLHGGCGKRTFSHALTSERLPRGVCRWQRLSGRREAGRRSLGEPADREAYPP